MEKYALSIFLYQRKHLKKFLNIMRISTLLLFVCIFASYASDLSSQTAKVNIANTRMTIGDFIKQVEKETGYMFVYNKGEIDANRTVSLKKGNNTVGDCLNRIFDGTGVSFVFDDGYVVLTKHSQTQAAVSQQSGKLVKGAVTDESGLSVIGANVFIKGTTVGTITDMEGNFSLEVPSDNDILVISYIGYVEQQIPVKNRKNWSIVLKEDAQNLDEVVVVGYGTQRKGNIATAVTTIKSDVLQNRPVQTVGEALQGQIPGLSVTAKGAPGESPKLQLRGSSVLKSDNSSEPLVLVDGVPADFNFLNPEDIESINVLKDAASSAIYGSRAANGVLLITTKRGKMGKPTFRYNGSVGVNTPMYMPQSISSAEYARIKNEAERNMGRAPIYTDEDISKFANGTDLNRYPNTNWLDLAIQNSVTTRHGLEASGGTEKVRYLVSAGVDHQTGIFPNTQQNVFNVRSSTDISITKKFGISFDIRYQLRDMDALNNQEDIYKQLIQADPTMVAYYTDGSYGYNPGFFTNPLVPLYEGGQKYTNRHEASGIFKLDYEIIDGLKFTGIANVKYTFKNEESRARKVFYKNYFTQEVFENGENSFSDRRDYNAYYNLQALLNYKKSFGIHNLDILAGYQQESENSDWLKGARSGYPTDIIWELNPGPKDNWSNDGNGEHWALASFIGRINYDYDNKYILSLSMRSDASSRFAKGSRWSTFPSVAAAWRISQESFMKGIRSWLDDLKIRASWGQTGSATGLGLYPSYTLISTGGLILNNTYQQIASLKTIGNQELTWEHSDMLNLGLDVKVLNSRLNFTGEYYIKNTKDILLEMPVPLEYGFGKPNMNVGEVRNKGWELSLSWDDRINDFGYSISGNLSDNRNEVIDLGGTGPWKGSNTYTDVGLPFNSIYGYESMGLFQSDEEVANAPFQNSNTAAGDIRYKNQNGDNKIDANDRVVIGDPNPHFLYGVNLGFDYKNFDLNMFFQGIGQKDRVIMDNFVRPFYDSSIFEHHLDYWTPENTGAKYPRILNKDDGTHNYQQSDYWMINAGYFRMKNLQIGYTIPREILRPAGFDRVRVYFSANNLFTVSDFVPGMDPESEKSVSYPFARTYSFGLNVQF
ncbi:SusC/RagA family TonB-linked outer membrane protein [Parabacteroides goldsteinii]|uniref:SusC/RagA family TonB-linked outer membrane protein n=7 Tax=Tannerellaceae TaxID=2005525 RepID=S0GRQ7_9BACT|nr:SusC/RagA family TonB-linked outer membrane protein [Parabacteroides goldsteinii dnLKV18]KAI4359639.1 TonB-dependent receptor P3 [Parabacteroides sp. ASF519]MBF0765093.1 TonB-dependent receptor [Parabacteroides goldsteinii]TFU73351.1 SusC/RagA family TonB-linked outer membrane protein [Parabacteroides sp. P14]NBI94097.1 SusC/RagA family TonB-linked outer membrane protein [Parabacteroides goldsteinii]